MQGPPAPASRNLRADLDRLELILTEGGDPSPELRLLGDPARLDLLFRLELAAVLRAGPGAELSPGRLLAVAQHAAASGTLPLATMPALRRTLRRLERRLYGAGAWDPARPPWWSPLPALSSSEELWQQAGRLEDALPKGRLAEAFVVAPQAPRWLSLPSLVPVSLIRAVHRQLEAAHGDGALDLERAGVGAGERLSARRSDSVLYLSGLEPVLGAAPAMATVVQWCLAHLGGLLAKAVKRRIHSPQKVMLARYPATSGGYHPHFDNPGGEDDNGRTLTFVLYLNAPEAACAGGEIAVWSPDAGTSAPGEPPAAVLPAEGGSAVLFDSRAVAHQVRPLAAGPARWAMTLWFSDAMQAPPPPRVPELSLTELLLPIPEPPLTPDRVLFHDLGRGEITVHSAGRVEPRVGIVCTAYRAGTGLDAWCEYHLALGVEHLVLVFDHLEDPREAADADRLAARHPPERLSVWLGSRVAAERWRAPGRLEDYARSGSACWAVAARQTLNASAALEAARGDELGGAPLDWLLHLDADELFYLEGVGRGGETLHQHFAAATASGLRLVRYANHELLSEERRRAGAPRFKCNPKLAAALLGPAGWSALVAHLEMAPTDPRPYFAGYFNGKAAVAVTHAAAAAGVHGWQLEAEGATPKGGQTRHFLAGPSVLHCHFADPAAFRRKYLAAEAAGDPPGSPLFEPSPAEVTIFERIRTLRREGADEASVERGLDELYATMTTFSDADVELLEAAGLIFEPDIERLPVDQSRASGLKEEKHAEKLV